MGRRSDKQEKAASGLGQPRFHYAWVIFVGCCLLQAGGIGTIMYTVGVFTVPVCEDLGFARSEFTLWITAHALTSIISYPLVAKLYRRYSFRVVLSISTLVTAIAAMLMSSYTELWQFVVSGIVYGSFGMAVLTLPQAVLITNWFHKWSGKAMGLSACFGSLFGALFAPLLYLVIEQAGWRTAYVVQGFVIMLFILPFSLFLFRLKPSEMDLLPYGYEMDNIGNAVPGKSASVAPKTTSVSQDSGVSAKVAMTSAAFIMVIIFIGTQNIVASGYDAHISAIGISYGLSAGFGALLVSSLQVGSAFGKFAYGFVSDLIGAKNATYITIVGIILGLFGMLLFRNPYLLMGSVFLFGLQDTLGSVASPLILKEIFGNRDFVTLFAWMRVGFGVFGAVAAPLVGLTYDLMGTYELALYMGLALCALILTSLALAYRQGRKLAWEAGKDDFADFKKTG